MYDTYIIDDRQADRKHLRNLLVQYQIQNGVEARITGCTFADPLTPQTVTVMYLLDAADGLRRAVCVVEVVVLDDVAAVQGTHVADNAALGAADVLFGGHGVGDVQLAVEDVVADVANAVIPALIDAAFPAEDAADSALAGDLRVDIAVFDPGAGGIRGRVGDITAASDAADVPALWDVVMAAGQEALDDTPNLLPVLKKAGVVDAGGQGILIIFEGMGKVFHGEPIVAGGEAAPNKAKLSTENAGKGVFTDDLMKVEDIKNGYCTQFLINKYEGASAAKMRAFAESNGDSVVCIEDDDVINLHVHTADPGKILSEAIKYGYLTNFKIENMHEQFLARQKQGKSLEKQASAEKAPSQASEFIYAAVDPSRDYGFVAVAAGEGLKAVFTDLAADAVVSGGQTMNPSIEDLSEAIEKTHAKTVFVLPNNGNVILAAQQAAELCEDKRVLVVPTKNVAMGIAAAVAFQPEQTPEENAAHMNEAAQRVRTGSVTYAVRDSELDNLHIHEGDIIGLYNGQIHTVGSNVHDVTRDLMREIVTEDDELITVYYGKDTAEADAKVLTDELAQMYGDCDVEMQPGGQPLYYYLVSVE